MERNVVRLGFTGALRATGLSLILPYVALYLRNVLGIDFAQIGVLIAVLGVAPVLIAPFGGLLTDRLGRRSLIVASLFVEASAVALTGVSMAYRSELGVIAAALAVSLAGAVGGPALSAFVADFASGSERTRGFTYLRIGWNVGFAIGVLAGGGLLAAIGFADVGILAGAILLAGSTVVAILLDPSPFDRARAIGRLGGPGAPPFFRTPLRRSLSLLTGDRIFLVMCVTFGVAELSVAQWGTTFPLYVNSVLGIPYAILGAGLALNGVLVVVAQAPTTQAAIGHRHTSLIALGIGLYVLGFLLFGLSGEWPMALVTGFFASVFVLTMGENVLSIPMSTLPSNLAPPHEVGAYNGTFNAVVGAGQVLAPTLGGLVLAGGFPSLETWAILMAPALPAFLVLQFWVVPRILDRPNRA